MPFPSKTQPAYPTETDAYTLSKMAIAPDHQQSAAIDHPNGPARIFAGAGSGKSTTGSYRIRRLINSGVNPSSILVLTFTRKGAEDFARKNKTVCGAKGAAVTIATFHKFAASEVAAYEATYGDRTKPRWSVLDENDSDDYWHQAFQEAAAEHLPSVFNEPLFTIDSKGAKNPYRDTERRIRALFDPLHEIYSYVVNQNAPTTDFAHAAAGRLRQRSSAYRALLEHPAHPSLHGYFGRGLARYVQIKHTHNARDYDDLLVGWRDLLKTDVAYRSRIQARFVHVIVDEYQDTNYLQEESLAQLCTQSLFVIGDVNQCIFAWRSAKPEIMLTFHERYPGGKDYPLEYNYRSRPEIIAPSNEILHLHHRMLQDSVLGDMPILTLKPTRTPGGKVHLIAGKTPYDETSQVAARIEALLNSGVPPQDIAIISRLSNLTRPLEARLRAYRFKGDPLPIQVWGGASLLDSKPARDLLSVLKLAERAGDPFPFQRIACLAPSIGEAAAADAFFAWIYLMPAPGPLQAMFRTIERISAVARSREGTVYDRLQTVVHAASEFLKETYNSDSKGDSLERKRHLKELADLTEGISEAIQNRLISGVTDSEDPTLGDLITQYSLDPKRDRVDPTALTITTVHQAKGLEWKHVFCFGVTEGSLPLVRRPSSDPAQPDAASSSENCIDLCEECRILYVAMTRAKDELSISFQASKPSSFLMQTTVLAERVSEAARAALVSSHEDAAYA